ncbi:biotin biosynthesis cytochrome P450-like enzyme [Asticcacaulis biprosthecium C19]|uniref:Biotin biosynthesis cytochrome P450-like enzyme n=1 Tax=Asticcacaulis biprosthecium C19 TaxID=715226 RepID=F4QTY3_9CAUL|nr:cytochrome P450 [Asticcacaulis biprosthecium]EGF89283.1 biotin biosynthesis cytochrome P450-like enzyme [Asticcacaulis biprosthecium C19]
MTPLPESQPDPGFEPLSDAFADDPYPTYARLRDHGAPWYFAGYDIWLLSRYEDVAAAAVHPACVRSPEAVMTPDEIAAQQVRDNWHNMPHHSRFVQFSLLNADGEVHQRLRRMIFNEFRTPSLQRLHAQTQVHVDRLIDTVIDAGAMDFIEDFAARVPGPVIGAFLGVPEEDCAPLRQWSDDIVQYFDIDRSDARKALAEKTTTEFYDYLLRLSDERRRRPQDDLISRLIARYDAGDLTEDAYISTCMLILMAGHGSTIDILGNGLAALFAHPDEQQRLSAGPSLMTTAVQEMFRYDAPLPFFHRFAAADFDLNGWHIRKGTKLGLLYGCANRDEAVFAHADCFDAGRAPNRHIAFASGPHVCLGNHLARMELDIVFSTLLRRLKDIAPAGESVRRRGLSVRGFEALPIAFRAA